MTCSRLVRGNGEVVEEIVSKQRQKEINKVDIALIRITDVTTSILNVNHFCHIVITWIVGGRGDVFN